MAQARVLSRAAGTALALLLAGCAVAPPYPDVALGPAGGPYAVMAEPQRFLGRDVLWGAMIVEAVNLADRTEIELLAFPLDARQRPIPEAADLGRFILVLPGFAEPADWPPGRFLTLHGRVLDLRAGSLRGEAYDWPLVHPHSVTLWPRDFRAGRRWSIGVGLRL